MIITINLTKVGGGTAVVLIEYITPISLHISAYRYSEKNNEKKWAITFLCGGGLSDYKIHYGSSRSRKQQQL